MLCKSIVFLLLSTVGCISVAYAAATPDDIICNVYAGYGQPDSTSPSGTSFICMADKITNASYYVSTGSDYQTTVLCKYGDGTQSPPMKMDSSCETGGTYSKEETATCNASAFGTKVVGSGNYNTGGNFKMDRIVCPGGKTRTDVHNSRLSFTSCGNNNKPIDVTCQVS
jgi:hypothetical protein